MKGRRSAATIVTSNRDPIEWLALMADPLLAQSAIDRLQSPHTNSPSTVSPTGVARSPEMAPTRTPSHAGRVVILDPRRAGRHHHPRRR